MLPKVTARKRRGCKTELCSQMLPVPLHGSFLRAEAPLAGGWGRMRVCSALLACLGRGVRLSLADILGAVAFG